MVTTVDNPETPVTIVAANRLHVSIRFFSLKTVSYFVVDEMGFTACILQRFVAGLTSSTRLSAVGRRPYYEIEKCNTSRVPDS